MREITVIYDGTLYTYKWIKTLYWAKSIFEKEGVIIKYLNIKSFLPISNIASHQIDDVLDAIETKKFDIVVLAYHYSISDFTNKAGLNKISFLKLLRNYCNKIVWLDTADSTGNCQFEVLPYVDMYLKKQLLKDLTLYTKSLYGSKLYTDYYHKRLGVDDSNIDNEYELLKPEYINRVRVSWNIGLSDFWTKSRYCLTRIHNICSPQYTPIVKNREVKLFFNGSMNYSPLNGYQRRRTIELIEEMNEPCNPSPTQKMTHEQYVNFMRNAKAAISPFGWGEICYRDFEAFVYGATLLKPDMNMIKTYPNFFVEEETYIPIDWDFKNFSEVVERIGSEKYNTVAKRAQEIFNHYVNGDNAKKLFVNHLLSSIEL